jgi:hypothetical protein
MTFASFKARVAAGQFSLGVVLLLFLGQTAQLSAETFSVYQMGGLIINVPDHLPKATFRSTRQLRPETYVEILEHAFVNPDNGNEEFRTLCRKTERSPHQITISEPLRRYFRQSACFTTTFIDSSAFFKLLRPGEDPRQGSMELALHLKFDEGWLTFEARYPFNGRSGPFDQQETEIFKEQGKTEMLTLAANYLSRYEWLGPKAPPPVDAKFKTLYGLQRLEEGQTEISPFDMWIQLDPADNMFNNVVHLTNLPIRWGWGSIGEMLGRYALQNSTNKKYVSIFFPRFREVAGRPGLEVVTLRSAGERMGLFWREIQDEAATYQHRPLYIEIAYVTPEMLRDGRFINYWDNILDNMRAVPGVKQAEQIDSSDDETILSIDEFYENINIRVPIPAGLQKVKSRYKSSLTFVSNLETWGKYHKNQYDRPFTEDFIIFEIRKAIFADMQEARSEVLSILPGDNKYLFGDIPDTYMGFGKNIETNISLYGITKIRSKYISALIVVISEHFNTDEEDKYKKMMREWMIKFRKANHTSLTSNEATRFIL